MKFWSTDKPDLPQSQDRRSLLKTGFFGGVLLMSGSIGAGLTGCSSRPVNKQPLTTTTESFKFLGNEDITLLKAISPTIIQGHTTNAAQPSSITPAQLNKLMRDIDTAIYYFSDANKKEVKELFDLLNFAPTRALIGGVWSSWENASQEDVEEFLNDWRYSSVSLFNKAYAALVKIVATSWYIQQENWHLAGYPGIPETAIAALPQFQN